MLRRPWFFKRQIALYGYSVTYLDVLITVPGFIDTIFDYLYGCFGK